MCRKGNPAAHSVRHSKAQFIQETHRQLAAVPVFREVVFVSGALPVADAVAVAADALTSGALFACLPASTFPLSSAPSSIASLSVSTSPVTCPVLHS